LAWFGENGELLGYRSTNFGSLPRLKKAVPGILAGFGDLQLLVVEGPKPFDEIWLKVAAKRGLHCERVDVETWRRAVLSSSEQTSGAKAKAAALEKARAIIRQSGAALPTSLNHDVAEAVLIGTWAAQVYFDEQ
jgi:hypothetical protein